MKQLYGAFVDSIFTQTVWCWLTPCTKGILSALELRTTPKLHMYPKSFSLGGWIQPKLFILAAKGFSSVGNFVPKIAFTILSQTEKKKKKGKKAFVSTEDNLIFLQ